MCLFGAILYLVDGVHACEINTANIERQSTFVFIIVRCNNLSVGWLLLEACDAPDGGRLPFQQYVSLGSGPPVSQVGQPRTTWQRNTDTQAQEMRRDLSEQACLWPESVRVNFLLAFISHTRYMCNKLNQFNVRFLEDLKRHASVVFLFSLHVCLKQRTLSLSCVVCVSSSSHPSIVCFQHTKPSQKLTLVWFLNAGFPTRWK